MATGEAAFEALAVTPDIDLVVLDLMLPGMSGYEVIERMRALPGLADLPVLVLSALSSPSARVRGLREGADDYMTKPFLPEEIVARARTLVMRRLLERRTAEMEALSRIAQAALTAASRSAPSTCRDRRGRVRPTSLSSTWSTRHAGARPRPPSDCGRRRAGADPAGRRRGGQATQPCASADPRRRADDPRVVIRHAPRGATVAMVARW